MKEHYYFFFVVLSFIFSFCAFAEQTCIIDSFRGKEVGHIESIRGHIYFGFEQSAFKSCGNNKSWWFGTVDPGLYKSLRDSFFKTKARKALFISGLACLSGNGEYGHMGGYDREVVFTKLDQQRPQTEHDCE